MPFTARERDLDLEEVREMIAGDELEIAREELLYLVSDCQGFLEAHNLLAELALETNDVRLARGHFGFGFETGLKALPAGFSGTLPAGEDYNAEFFAAGKGLARCLVALKLMDQAREVLQQLARFDPSEPDVPAWLKEIAAQEQQLSFLLPILDVPAGPSSSDSLNALDEQDDLEDLEEDDDDE